MIHSLLTRIFSGRPIIRNQAKWHYCPSRMLDPILIAERRDNLASLHLHYPLLLSFLTTSTQYCCVWFLYVCLLISSSKGIYLPLSNNIPTNHIIPTIPSSQVFIVCSNRDKINLSLLFILPITCSRSQRIIDLFVLKRNFSTFFTFTIYQFPRVAKTCIPHSVVG